MQLRGCHFRELVMIPGLLAACGCAECPICRGVFTVRGLRRHLQACASKAWAAYLADRRRRVMPVLVRPPVTKGGRR